MFTRSPMATTAFRRRERGSRVPQLELNHFGVRTAEHAPRGPLGGVPPGRAAFKGSSKEIRASGLLRH